MPDVSCLTSGAAGSRLLARWRAADGSLNIKTGVMGLCRELPNPFAGAIGAESTRKATVEMLINACRPSPPPYVDEATAGKFDVVDQPLFDHLTSIIEVCAADAASGEQKDRTLALCVEALNVLLWLAQSCHAWLALPSSKCFLGSAR